MQYSFFRPVLNKSNQRPSCIVFKYSVPGQYEDWSGTFLKLPLPFLVLQPAAKSTSWWTSIYDQTVLLSFNQTSAECCAENFSVAQTRACRCGDLGEVSQLLSKVGAQWSIQGVNLPPFISMEILKALYYAVPGWRGTYPLVVVELNAAV